jgi:hypothetical protein
MPLTPVKRWFEETDVTPSPLRSARWRCYGISESYRLKYNFGVALRVKAPNHGGFPRHLSLPRLINLKATMWRKRRMEAMRDAVEQNNRLMGMVRTMRKRVV